MNAAHRWIRFTMDNSGIITYKDYAYNSLPSTSIEAGQTSSGLPVGLLSFQARKISSGGLFKCYL